MLFLLLMVTGWGWVLLWWKQQFTCSFFLVTDTVGILIGSAFLLWIIVVWCGYMQFV